MSIKVYHLIPPVVLNPTDNQLKKNRALCTASSKNLAKSGASQLEDSKYSGWQGNEGGKLFKSQLLLEKTEQCFNKTLSFLQRNLNLRIGGIFADEFAQMIVNWQNYCRILDILIG